MTYEDFLFSQLFMNHVEKNETQYQELEYDSMYSEVLRHREAFLKSKYNTDLESEYNCIVTYCLNELKH